MTISEDISDVLEEVGTSLTIYKPDGTTVTGEYIDHESHTDHTTPLIRAFMSDFTLSAETQAVVGDVVGFAGKTVLILVREPEYFEDAVVDYLASGYKSNSIGDFESYNQDGGWDAEYKKIKGWNSNHESVRAVLMDQQFRSKMLSIADESMEIELDRLHLYVSDYYTVAPGDRYRVSATEKYKVEQIESYKMPGIQIVFLTEDERE